MSQGCLFDHPAFGNTRHSDPVTSVAAARAPRGTKGAVLEAFVEWGPMTDEQLADRLAPQGHYAPTVKTARSALMRQGLLAPAGRFGVSRRGQQQIVWRLTREAAA